MAAIRIEWVPIALWNLGSFGFDHLQLVFQQDESSERLEQDDWWVVEGVRADRGPGNPPVLQVLGADGRTTLIEANTNFNEPPISSEELVARIGTPQSRGSRIIPFLDAGGAWLTITDFADEIDIQNLPYLASGYIGTALPTLNSTSVIASVLHYAGSSLTANIPFGMRFSPGATTLIGTSLDDDMRIEAGFKSLVGGRGNDTFSGTNGGSDIESFYGGEGEDFFNWSKGQNIYHGGQPNLDYVSDGIDTIDYSGINDVIIKINEDHVPHVFAQYFAQHAEGFDWLLSVERLQWGATDDRIELGPKLELLEDGLIIDLGDQQGGTKGDKADLSSFESGVLFNRATENALFLQPAEGAQPRKGLWLENAEWVVGTNSDDLIYAHEEMRFIDGSAGNDLVDARLVDAFTGLSPNGYDVEITGGIGDDVIVSGQGRSYAIGGDGDDMFVLAAMTSSEDDVEFIIDQAESGDSLFVAHNFFNGSDAGFEESALMPILGAPGNFSDMVENGWSLFYEWRLEDDKFFGTDLTEGLLPFIGAMAFRMEDADLVVDLYQGTKVDREHVEPDGTILPYQAASLSLETKTMIRVVDFTEGDLGITFLDIGEADGTIEGLRGTGAHFPGYDPVIRILTDNGQLLDPLDLRPEAPASNPNENGGIEPEIVSGSPSNDIITAAAFSSIISAGDGNDIVTGGEGDDRIDGGTGDDELSGRTGNDKYIVDSTADTVNEVSGEGTDEIFTTVNLVLPDAVENITLNGDATLATGNELDNRIIGNALDNVLVGLDGDDVLYGGLGDDQLSGGEGADRYVYNAGDGDDVIIDNGAEEQIDQLTFAGATAPEDVTFVRLQASPDDLVLHLSSGGRIAISDFFAGGGAGIDAIQFDPETIWSRADIELAGLSATPLADDPPQAQDDLFIVMRAGAGRLASEILLANDRDFNGDALSITAVWNVTDGVTASVIDGDIDISAPEGFTGALSFDYTITDSNGGLSTARAEVTVVPNAAPTLVTQPEDQASPEDSPVLFTLPEGLFEDFDADPLTLSATLAGAQPLPAWLQFDAENGTFAGTPPQDFFGDLTIELAASDGIAAEVTIFTLSILPVNDTPSASPDTDFMTSAGAALTIDPQVLLSNDVDPDGDALQVISVAAGIGGTVEIGADDNIVFTPDANFEGVAEFSYTASDPGGLTSTATVEIVVEAASDGSTIIGDASDNTLIGTAADDVLKGKGGDDILIGNAGDDKFVIKKHDGFDVFDGGEGFDLIRGTREDDIIGLANVENNLSGIEKINGRSGFDVIRATTGDDNVDLSAIDVRNIEQIELRAGDDEFLGSSGRDLVSGGGGDDILRGGAGNDRFLIDGNDGFDFFDGGDGYDVIRGSNEDDKIGIASVDGNLSGIEKISGRGGFDMVRGTASADRFDFSGLEVRGIELINMRDGDDVFIAGASDETIRGGGGNDTFVFRETTGNDIITDFKTGSTANPLRDVIDLSATAFETFDQIIAASTSDGADTVITLGEASSLRLNDVAIGALRADDFYLG